MSNWNQIFVGIQICLSFQLILVCFINIFEKQQKNIVLATFCLLLLQVPILHIFRFSIANSSFLYIFFGSWKGFFYGPLLYLYLKSLNSNYKLGGLVSHLVLPSFLVVLGLIGHFYFNTGDMVSVFTHTTQKVGIVIKSIGYLSYWILIIVYFVKGLKEYKSYINKELKLKARTRFFTFYLVVNIHLLSTILPGLILYMSNLFDSKTIESLNTNVITPYYHYIAMPQYMILFGFLIFYNITESKWLKGVYLTDKIFNESFIDNSKELDVIFNRIFNEEKLYRNCHLTIDELSINLKIKKHVIRNHILNRGYRSFTSFINEYRINDFIERIKSNEDEKHTLNFLAQESGFNSRATFYRVFKKHFGMPPTEYVRKHL